MDESTPIRPRSGSVGFIDTPLGMGPATTLRSPRHYSNLGAVGGEVLELTSQPSATFGEAAALPPLQPRERHHAMRDSVSTNVGDDSASTSVIMDSEYMVIDNHRLIPLFNLLSELTNLPLPVPPERMGLGGLLLELLTRPLLRGCLAVSLLKG